MSSIHTIASDHFSNLVREFADVFSTDLGKYTGSPVSFNLDPSIAPIWLKPHRVPFALCPKVDQEIDKLLAQSILEPVDHACWEMPIIIPIKADGSIRICTDYKATINKALGESVSCSSGPAPSPFVGPG